MKRGVIKSLGEGIVRHHEAIIAVIALLFGFVIPYSIEWGRIGRHEQAELRISIYLMISTVLFLTVYMFLQMLIVWSLVADSGGLREEIRSARAFEESASRNAALLAAHFVSIYATRTEFQKKCREIQGVLFNGPIVNEGEKRQIIDMWVRRTLEYFCNSLSDIYSLKKSVEGGVNVHISLLSPPHEKPVCKMSVNCRFTSQDRVRYELRARDATIVHMNSLYDFLVDEKSETI